MEASDHWRDAELAVLREQFSAALGEPLLQSLTTMTVDELKALPPFPFPQELFPPGTFPPGLRFSSEGIASLPRITKMAAKSCSLAEPNPAMAPAPVPLPTW